VSALELEDSLPMAEDKDDAADVQIGDDVCAMTHWGGFYSTRLRTSFRFSIA
jgi:hypothetical protein